jgi:peptidoglycan/xylan/chitin deacetylase (PgdA/CDA1 family)
VAKPPEVDERLDWTFYLHERYASGPAQSRLVRLYYGLKPLLPRRLQIALRRAYASRQKRRQFPAWPIESVLVDLQHREFRRDLRRSGAEEVPFVNFWPERNRFAFVLTHDVEGPAGVANIPRLLEIERRHGLVSAWYFVAEDYPTDPELFEELRASGCEIGLHGITHRGSLFKDRSHFARQLPRIHRYLEAWRADGFRSPALHRNADWMAELGCRYDSSFPDTDPFEPQPGGCCSIWPYFLGDLVELPITVVQDHTLFEILRERSIDLWVTKSEWIIRHHGLINVIVHPDYALTDERLKRYEEFIAFLARQEGGWHALPREVAHWWRVRERARVERRNGEPPSIVGVSDPRVTIAHAREEGGAILIDT